MCKSILPTQVREREREIYQLFHYIPVNDGKFSSLQKIIWPVDSYNLIVYQPSYPAIT